MAAASSENSRLRRPPFFLRGGAAPSAIYFLAGGADTDTDTSATGPIQCPGSFLELLAGGSIYTDAGGGGGACLGGVSWAGVLVIASASPTASRSSSSFSSWAMGAAVSGRCSGFLQPAATEPEHIRNGIEQLKMKRDDLTEAAETLLNQAVEAMDLHGDERTAQDKTTRAISLMYVANEYDAEIQDYEEIVTTEMTVKSMAQLNNTTAYMDYQLSRSQGAGSLNSALADLEAKRTQRHAHRNNLLNARNTAVEAFTSIQRGKTVAQKHLAAKAKENQAAPTNVQWQTVLAKHAAIMKERAGASLPSVPATVPATSVASAPTSSPPVIQQQPPSRAPRARESRVVVMA